MTNMDIFLAGIRQDSRLASGVRRSIIAMELIDGANLEIDGIKAQLHVTAEIDILNELLRLMDPDTGGPISFP